MTIEELIAEGEALSKPCFLLSSQEKSGEVVGYWGGERSDIPNRLQPEVKAFSGREHIVTIHEKLLTSLGLTSLTPFGPVGLFEWTNTNDEWSYSLESGYHKQFSRLSCTGEPLYATSASSFPPFEAVCLHGSERVAAWLTEQGLKRHDYWRVLGNVVGEYTDEFNRRDFMFRTDIDVIVGGWHMMWPEDDFYMPAEINFLFRTLRDAEPWLEGWHSPAHKSFFCKERIT